MIQFLKAAAIYFNNNKKNLMVGRKKTASVSCQCVTSYCNLGLNMYFLFLGRWFTSQAENHLFCHCKIHYINII